MADDEGFVPAESVTIRDQVAVIGRRWRVVALFVLLGVVGSALYLQERSQKYVSNAQVHVSQASTNEFAPGSTPVASAVSMPTEQNLATSLPVATAAARALGNGITPHQALSHLSVTVPASTQILNFAYSASKPLAARAGSNAFEQAYLANRRATIASSLATLRTSLLATKKSLDAQHLALATALSKTNNATKKFQINVAQAALVPQLASNANALTSLDTVDPQAAVAQGASLPLHRSGANSLIVIAAGIVGGLVLGLIAAFMIDAGDDHIRGPHDLVAILGIPVLARVPVVRSGRHNAQAVRADDGSHPKVAEAYRLLANRLIVTASKDSISSLLIVSPAQGEGRSTVAANLSATFVELGFRVWLVSADLMPPQMHTLFAPDEPAGLINVVPIAPDVSSASALTALEFGDDPPDGTGGHLTLMASAERPLPAGRLLNPLVLARQVSQNQGLVDITIIDTPAMLEFADAVPLIPVVDGVVVVADAALTYRSELSELADLLAGTEARVIGSVLNRDGARVSSPRASRARRRARRSGARASAATTAAAAESATSVVPSRPATEAAPPAADVGWPATETAHDSSSGGA